MRSDRPRFRPTAVVAAILAGVFAAAVPVSPKGANAASVETHRTLRLERVEVTGSHRTPERIIRRYAGLSPGDAVTVDGIEAARARLVATDYFERVDIYTRRGSERGSVVVVVEVDEHSNPVVETGFGYHDLNGWFLTLVGLRLDNTLGADSRTRVGLRVGFRLSGLDADWSRPVSGDGQFRLGAKLHVYNFQHRFFGAGPAATSPGGDPAPWGSNGWSGFEQDVGRGGGEISLDYSPERHTRFSFGVAAERVEPDSSFKNTDDDSKFDAEDYPAAIAGELGTTTITGFFFRAIRDTRDNTAYPTSGAFSRLTLDINNSLLGGDEIYTKAELDVRTHVHLRDGWVWSSHASAGVTTDGAPYYERYYLGGIYSIRGFQEWSLSATDGDDGYWTVNEELRWPLVGRAGEPPRLAGLVFVDVGQGWQRDEAFTAADVESAVGYGLRLRLPWIGTFGFDVGIPMSAGRTDDPFRAHASLGFSF